MRLRVLPAVASDDPLLRGRSEPDWGLSHCVDRQRKAPRNSIYRQSGDKTVARVRPQL